MIRKFRFRLAVRHQLSKMLSSGKINKVEHARLLKAASYSNCGDILDQVVAKSANGEFPIIEKILAFCVEHWDEILKVLITLAALVMDEKDKN